MTHYEPVKIIQLLQLCCWRGRTEMSQNGLIELASKIGPDKTETKHQTPNERYLVDLLSDARKNLKHDTTINKRESFINLLLNYVGFNNWDDWKEALRKPGNFFSDEETDLEIAEKTLTVVYPLLLHHQLYPTLSFAEKSSSLDLVSFDEDSLMSLAKQTLTQLEKSTLIICAIPSSWKEQATKMRNPAWGEFSGTGRILPVWVETDEWKQDTPFIPSIKQDQSAAGLPGILIGSLFKDYYTKALLNAAEKQSSSNTSGENAPNINNSTIGFYMQGGTVNHLSTGGDQTINNYFK